MPRRKEYRSMTPEQRERKRIYENNWKRGRTKERRKRDTDNHRKWVRAQGEKFRKMHRAYTKKWIKMKPENHLNRIMSVAIYNSLRGKKECKKWNSLVNYTVEDLKKHLEKQFDNKMNWENQGSYWQVHHKTPISWFKFNSFKDRQFKLCWSLNNLQPLSAKDNTLKSNRLILES